MHLQQQHERFTAMRQQRRKNGCSCCMGRRIAVAVMQVAMMQQLLHFTQQHFGIQGQITDPSTVQIGDTVWYVTLVLR
jgi:hypothetical protein